MIHKSAIVSSKAELHESVIVDPFAIIEDNARIGEGSHIKAHAYIASGARIGKNVTISQGAIVSTVPQDLKFEGEETVTNIGDETILREYATVNRGTNESGSTDIGKNCLIMAYAHVAHDCKIGNNVIMANSVNLAGHVHINDFAIVGGVVPVHQFVKIGCHSIVGGGYRLPQDVCPYATVGGYPLKIIGVNVIGLRRRNFPPETIQTIRDTFKILFHSNLNTRQAVERINESTEIIPEVQKILDFIKSSDRGLVK
jgi:UDP-N-acetylglucosamine acyltransferase